MNNELMINSLAKGLNVINTAGKIKKLTDYIKIITAVTSVIIIVINFAGAIKKSG